MLSPPLAALRREMGDATERAHRVAADARDHWGTRPGPGRWSVAECIDHLNATSRAYLPDMRRAVARARALGRPPRVTYRRDFVGWLLSWSLEPPVRKRFTTSPLFVPQAIRSRGVVLPEFDRWQQELNELLDQVATVDAAAVKVGSWFNPRIKYSLYSAYRILTAHERRHLWQAEQVVEALNPTAAAT